MNFKRNDEHFTLANLSIYYGKIQNKHMQKLN